MTSRYLRHPCRAIFIELRYVQSQFDCAVDLANHCKGKEHIKNLVLRRPSYSNMLVDNEAKFIQALNALLHCEVVAFDAEGLDLSRTGPRSAYPRGRQGSRLYY